MNSNAKRLKNDQEELKKAFQDTLKEIREKPAYIDGKLLNRRYEAIEGRVNAL
jgi:hypothetical protein